MIRAVGEKIVLREVTFVGEATSALLDTSAAEVKPVLARGIVASVGPRVDRRNYPVEPGDVVWFRPYLCEEPLFVQVGEEWLIPSSQLYLYGESKLALGSRVVVKEIDTKAAKYGLIEVCRFEPATLVSGTVSSVGPMAHVDVQIGQRVWFKRECGYELGEGLTALNQDQLACESSAELEAMRNWYQRA